MKTSNPNRGEYMVYGFDSESGGSTSLKVVSGDLRSASDFAESRGVVISKIVNSSGTVYVPVGNGGFVVSNTKRSEKIAAGAASRAVGKEANTETGLLVLSLLIPLVGFIAGAIRLANKDNSGIPLVIAAVFGSIIGSVLITLIMDG